MKEVFMQIRNTLAGGAVALSLVMASALPAMAATNVVVTPSNTNGWSTGDTNTGGTVTFVTDATSPLPNGALQLTTNGTNEARAQYLHAANTPLSDLNDLSYSTKQVSGPPTADPSYQVL